MLLVAATTALGMAGLAVSGAALAQENGDQTIEAKALDDHECDDTEWHFVITHVDDPDDAPESINVTWANGAQADVELDRVTGKVAHYTTTLHLDSSVTQATAEIDDDWNGQFNLSHGPCEVEEEEHEVTINVMKHICSADVQSREEFDAIELNGDGNTTFVDKVLACPTVVMPGDDYANGAVAFDGKRTFDFEIEDAEGSTHGIDGATFKQQQICESESASQDGDALTGVVGADVNGDSDLDDCLDTSLYAYDGVANGNVLVTETDPPGDTRPGALEFTPQALNPNNDADTLLEDLEEVFADDDSIELDTTQDDNGEITLHVYDFVNVPPQEVPCPTLTATAEEGPNNHLEWTEVAGADGYNVYRAVGDGSFELLESVNGDTHELDDGDVEQGETYRYTVNAVVDEQEAEGCNVVEVTAIPVFPTAIAAASAAVLGLGAYAVIKRRS